MRGGKPANTHAIGGWRSQSAVLWACAALLLFAVAAWAADKLPPVPPRYFNDYANVASKSTAESLNQQLEQFERETSNQILVVVYPKLDSDLEMADFTQRTFDSWKVGRQKINNGAVFFVFAQDRKMRIEVGYGLEGVIPDILAKQILDNEVRPSFRTGNYNAGLTNGVNALIKATRGEYKGTGKTVKEGERGEEESLGLFWGFICPMFVLFVLWSIFRGSGPGGRGYGRRGSRSFRPPIIFWGGGGGGWGGGGGGWGGGGGGFSGGGGMSGGGGASGSW